MFGTTWMYRDLRECLPLFDAGDGEWYRSIRPANLTDGRVELSPTELLSLLSEFAREHTPDFRCG